MEVPGQELLVYILRHQDKFGAIPESQRVAQEDETPHESSKESHHYPFPNSPALGKHKIFLIPVKKTFESILATAA